MPTPAPAACQVDVWRLSLTAPEAARARLWESLSEPERGRAERFAFERDRARFVVAHGALRSILSSYAQIPAPQLELESGPGGKPRVASPGELRFNLSHSGDAALVAVTWDREVGIDLEAVRAIDDLDALAATCFSPTERRALAAVPEALRLPAFFDGWTRKEAFLKLLGDGLSRPLDSFDVSLAPGEEPALLRVAGASAGEWTLQAIEVGAAYRAALASPGPAPVIRLREWVDPGETR